MSTVDVSRSRIGSLPSQLLQWIFARARSDDDRADTTVILIEIVRDDIVATIAADFYHCAQ